MERAMKTDLIELGWSEHFEQLHRQNPEWIPARICAEHRGAYQVWTAKGEGTARLSGKLRFHFEEHGLPPGVGDWVALAEEPGGAEPVTVQQLYPRRTVFTRGSASKESKPQVIGANVDRVFVVCGLDRDYNLRRIERYLALVWASGAQPLIVLSKADLVDDPAEYIAEVQANAPGAEVLALSSWRGDNLAAVRARISPGCTAALVGSSGAGKSTLLNAWVGEEAMATGEVRPKDGRGRHTTVHRQLVRLAGGGLLLDTPGMRELQLADESGLDLAFDDVASFARECRFRDCDHTAEPGCAVVAAIEAGALEPIRLEHYQQLQSEARAYERRHNARLRKADARAAGRMIREAHQQAKRKRGELF
jgi:ribosome biogenesis GTPase